MNTYEKQVKDLVNQAAKGKRISPLKAIRAKCLDCCCFQSGEVRKCTAKNCPLWYFRFGKNKTSKPTKAQIEAGKRLAKSQQK